jgi:hypothetical protein
MKRRRFITGTAAVTLMFGLGLGSQVLRADVESNLGCVIMQRPDGCIGALNVELDCIDKECFIVLPDSKK